MNALPTKVAFGLAAVVTAASLFAASNAGAAAYYVGGGRGVRLAVRVVDHQIVWTKLRVLKQCVASDRGHYHYVESSEGLAGEVAVGRRGRFGWHSKAKTVGENGDESTNGESFSGRVSPTRLVGRFLSYGWFTSSEPPGTHSHGRCRGGSGARPPVHPVAAHITAQRRPEPPGLAFYFAQRRRGITAYFEVRRGRILRSEVGALHFCTDRKGGRHYDYELSAFQAPIRIGSTGGFRFRQPPDELRPLEVLRGKVDPTRIIGSYGYSYGGARDRCRTGSFEPGDNQGWAVPFVASRR